IQIQPRHKFLWNGVVAVLLAFSLMLSVIFLLKIGGEYSRGAFLAQCLSVGAAVFAVRALTFSKVHSAIASGRIEARRVGINGESREVPQFARRMKSAGVRTVWSCEFPAWCKPRFVNGSGFTTKPVQEVIARCREFEPDDVFIIAKHEGLPLVNSL